jgi:multiple sugar transport system ATP-binding protein
MAIVTFDGVSMTYPNSDTPAIDSLDLEVADGEFLVLVGPSGCGKSTTLRMVAGLEATSSGSIRVDGQDITHLLPKDRDVAMVFQNYALYPHMTVAQNIGYHLKLQKKPKAEIKERVEEAARLLGMEEFLDRKPGHLSGGQRQRVAMGRAIVRRPKVFLMDEPLSNLDAKLRVQTRAQIASLQRRFGVTTLYVTHDQVEAMTMGDRVAVLRDGVLQQCAPPRDLYSRPLNTFIAGFIGSPPMNLLPATVDGDRLRVSGGELPLPEGAAAVLKGRETVVGVRPEHLRLVGDGEAGVVGEVEVLEDLGADLYAYVLYPEHEEPLIVRCDPRRPPHKGERIMMAAAPGDLHLFDAESGDRVDW